MYVGCIASLSHGSHWDYVFSGSFSCWMSVYWSTTMKQVLGIMTDIFPELKFVHWLSVLEGRLISSLMCSLLSSACSATVGSLTSVLAVNFYPVYIAHLWDLWSLGAQAGWHVEDTQTLWLCPVSQPQFFYYYFFAFFFFFKMNAEIVVGIFFFSNISNSKL